MGNFHYEMVSDDITNSPLLVLYIAYFVLYSLLVTYLQVMRVTRLQVCMSHQIVLREDQQD